MKRLLSLSAVGAVVVIAYLNARAVSFLVDATLTTAASPVARYEAPTTQESKAKSAAPILERNPFDHASRLVPQPVNDAPSGALDVPPCDGVRAIMTVAAIDPAASFAALEIAGRRLLRGRGGRVDDLRVLHVGVDRIWLSRNDDAVCQARVFDKQAATSKEKPSAPQAGGLASDLANKIAQTGPTEFQIDRSAFDRLMEAQAELMKTPLAPEKQNGAVVGFRLIRVDKSSILYTLGLRTNDRLVAINNVEVTQPERVLEAYARLRAGNLDRLSITIVRSGKTTNIDYLIK